MASPKPPNRHCVTFLTDFGTRDTYVGQMKGVALAINPAVQLVDLSHEIPPQDILRGAFAWNDAVASFPHKTIHVGVVDPGVGSERRVIAAEIGDHCFVCPDNGLLSVILQKATVRRIVCLDNPAWWRSEVSNTFHGRDIMTPVAAAWSLGHDLAEFGTPLTAPLVILPSADVIRGRTFLNGQVIAIDRFGNLITNLESCEIPQSATSVHVELGAFRVNGVSKCYSDVPQGEPVALTGSSGRIEISIRNGSAADELQAECGRRVIIRWTGANE